MVALLLMLSLYAPVFLSISGYSPLRALSGTKLHILSSRSPLKSQTRRYCIDFEATPSDATSRRGSANLADDWKTVESNIISIDHTPFTGKAELITFDAFATLIQPSQSIGKWYREALNDVCDMTIRLPRPQLFSDSFQRIYKKFDTDYPCFGSSTEGMSTEDWWYQVIKQTYLNTQYFSAVDENELDTLMPKLFDLLYHDVFSTKAGWHVKEDVVYTLDKLRSWRDQGAGPKIGVISNFDNRLIKILEDLELNQYLDFIITSQDCQAAKPEKEIFDRAFAAATVTDTTNCYHVGDSEESDVCGAIAAGWHPIRYRESFDEDFPDWLNIDTIEEAQTEQNEEAREAVLKWGRKNVDTGNEWTEIWGLDDILSLFGFPDDDDKLIPTTIVKGIYED